MVLQILDDLIEALQEARAQAGDGKKKVLYSDGTALLEVEGWVFDDGNDCVRII